MTEVTGLTDFARAVRACRDFDQAAGLVLHRSLATAVAALDASEFAQHGRMMRAMLHLRPREGYRGLVSLDLGESAPREVSGELSYLPSSRAWRYVAERRVPVAVDVTLSTIHVEDAAIQDDASDADLLAPQEVWRSRQLFIDRDTTHVLVLPLIGATEAVIGMVAIEACCQRAIGTTFIWPHCAGDLELMLALVAPSLAEARVAATESEQTHPLLPVVGRSTARLINMLRAFARQPETILLRGPTGVGKSRLARWCHAISSRAEAPFEVVDLLSVPEDMQMAELFGWRKGAFTGAVGGHAGAVTRAEGGTLFIDEIDKLSLKAQAGLLHLLEERQYRILGDSGPPQQADVRFIVASNIDLVEAVENGVFREDLLYRINVLPVSVPSLAERPDEVASWADYMLARQSEESGAAAPALSPAAVDMLARQVWPGNLRQLDNVVRRACAIARSELVEEDAELRLLDRHVESALLFEHSGGRKGFAEAFTRAANEFVAECDRLKDASEVLDLDLTEAFRGMVLLKAIRRYGSPEDAFRALGKDKLVSMRNHHKALKRAVAKVSELEQRLSIELDEQASDLGGV